MPSYHHIRVWGVRVPVVQALSLALERRASLKFQQGVSLVSTSLQHSLGHPLLLDVLPPVLLSPGPPVGMLPEPWRRVSLGGALACAQGWVGMHITSGWWWAAVWGPALLAGLEPAHSVPVPPCSLAFGAPVAVLEALVWVCSTGLPGGGISSSSPTGEWQGVLDAAAVSAVFLMRG